MTCRSWRASQIGRHPFQIGQKQLDVGWSVLNRDRPLFALAPRREENSSVVLVEPMCVTPLVGIGQEVTVVAQLVVENDRALRAKRTDVAR